MKLLIAAFVLLNTHLTLGAETGHSGSKPKFIIYEKAAPVSSNTLVPDQPEILAPEPLKLITDADVQLKWSAVQNADAYALQISDDSNFFKILINESSYAQTEYTFKGGEKAKQYYWRVAALRTTNKPGSMKSLFKRSSFLK